MFKILNYLFFQHLYKPILGEVLGTGGAALIGGGFGYMGTKETNSANAEIANTRNIFEMHEADRARKFTADQTDRNRKFQQDQVLQLMGFNERMSSTAVQRRMQDMEKAGINPILAGKYDASSPAGAAASGGIGGTAKANAHGYEAKNKIQGMLDNLNTALSLKQLAANIDNVEANTELTRNKTGITDPVESIMEIVKGAIDHYTGTSAKDKGEVIPKVEKAVSEILGGMKNRPPPQSPEPSKGNPLKKPIQGLPKGQVRHEFIFKR